MELFNKIDDAVLLWFTKISHQFQRLTGRTNFFLAKIGFVLGSLFLITGVSNYFFHIIPGHHDSILELIMFLVLTPLWFRDIRRCDEAEEKTLLSPTQAKLPITPGIRLLCLAFACTDVIDIMFNSHSSYFIFEVLHKDYGIALTIFLYFASVDLLPPSQSEVSQWLEAFRATFRSTSQAPNKA